MNKITFAMAPAALLLVAQTAVADVSNFGFHGYFRSGMGSSDKGGDQVCFGLPGVSKYRFGNECSSYGELQLSADVAKIKDGPTFNYTLMLGYYTNNSNSSVAGGSEPIGIDARQNFVSVTGVGEGALKNANFWMGRRYYQRHDVHINDFFYWSQRGVGAGVENLAVGPGKLHLAFLRSYNDTTSGAGGNGAGNTGNSLDIRYSDLPVNPDGKLEFGIDLRSADRTKIAGNAHVKDGFLATVEHTQSNILGGYKKLALQYGRDAGANLATNDPGSFNFTTTGLKAWRVVEQLVIQPSNRFSAMGTFIYEDSELAANSSRKWTSIGVRPMWHWAEYWSSAFELGHDRVKYDKPGNVLDGKTATLTKFTIAPLILRPGTGFWQRPELRLFATFAKWNENANIAASQAGAIGNNLTGSLGYAGTTSGRTIGAQVEAWF